MKRANYAIHLVIFTAALAWLPSYHSPGAEPARVSEASSVASAASDGIPVGFDFDVPLLVSGKSTQGRGFVSADRVLRVYWVADGKVAGPMLYVLTRQGDVGPGPQPPIPPKPPTPDPPPTPVVKATRVMLIHETGDDTPVVAAIRNNLAWKTESEKLGMAWRIADPDTIAKTYPAMVAAAKKVGLPAVIFMDSTGFVTAAEKLPKTPADMLALVRKVGK